MSDIENLSASTKAREAEAHARMTLLPVIEEIAHNIVNGGLSDETAQIAHSKQAGNILSHVLELAKKELTLQK